MKLLTILYNSLNKVFLIIPFVLFIFSFLLALKFGIVPASFTTQNSKYEIWKYWMNIAYFFYVAAAVIVLFWWAYQEKKTFKTFFKAFRNWFLGFLLTLFSYALVGLVIDFGFVFCFLFLLMSKK